MTLASKIEAALLHVVRTYIPDVDSGGLHQDSQTKHWTLDPAWLVDEELDLTLVAQALAETITLKIDSPELGDA